MTVLDMIKRVQRASPLVEAFVGEAIQRTSEDAVRFNQKQLLDGLKPDGNFTAKYRSVQYAEMKKSVGIKSLPYADYKLTGDMFAGMYVLVKGDIVTFDTTDKKGVWQVQREARLGVGSPEIFGLSDESIREYAKIYMPVARRLMRDQILG